MILAMSKPANYAANSINNDKFNKIYAANSINGNIKIILTLSANLIS